MASPLRSLSDTLATATRAHAVRSGTRLTSAIRTSRRFLLSLAALLALLSFMAAAPIRSLDAANQQVSHLEATREQLASSVEDLEARKRRLGTDEEIELLARSRFGLVMPGEQAYVVVTPEDDVRTSGEPEAADGHRPWYRWLLEAVGDMLPS